MENQLVYIVGLITFQVIFVMTLGLRLWASLFAYRTLHFQSVRWLWGLWGIIIAASVMTMFQSRNVVGLFGSSPLAAPLLCFGLAYLLVKLLLLADAAAFVLKERPEIRLPVGQWIAPLRHLSPLIGGVALFCALTGLALTLPANQGSAIGQTWLPWVANILWFIGIAGGLVVSWEAWRRLGFRSVLWLWALFVVSTVSAKFIAARSGNLSWAPPGIMIAMWLGGVVMTLGTWLVYADAIAFVQRVRPELRSPFFPFFGWLHRHITLVGALLMVILVLASAVVLCSGPWERPQNLSPQEKKTDFSAEKAVP